MRSAYACGTPVRQDIVKAAAQGFKAVYHASDGPYTEGDAIVWGLIRGAPGLIQKVKSAKGNYWHMDNAYLRRNRYYRITKNANQVTELSVRTPERFEKIGGTEFRPWKRGKKIVLALSTEHLYKFHGMDIKQYTDDTVKEIRKFTDRKITVRPKNATYPIENDLQDAWCLVTHTSCSALDALRWGVPVITTGECCAKPVSGKMENIENLELPEREPLFWHLAWHQFTLDELKEGLWCSESS